MYVGYSASLVLDEAELIEGFFGNTDLTQTITIEPVRLGKAELLRDWVLVQDERVIHVDMCRSPVLQLVVQVYCKGTRTVTVTFWGIWSSRPVKPSQGVVLMFSNRQGVMCARQCSEILRIRPINQLAQDPVFESISQRPRRLHQSVVAGL
ncbi:hypothetical protein D3C80_1418000 [compost metagenome]